MRRSTVRKETLSTGGVGEINRVTTVVPARESELLPFRRISIWAHGYTVIGDRREISSMYL